MFPVSSINAGKHRIRQICTDIKVFRHFTKAQRSDNDFRRQKHTLNLIFDEKRGISHFRNPKTKPRGQSETPRGESVVVYDSLRFRAHFLRNSFLFLLGRYP